ncbi:uncharacterized protein LOC143282736 [Babylonia areolata]|uniref:uncharacterized protein LOC143282736 n=1 Tax=Babylonia areolata TaxID=304850 RepID=UPI003FD42C11
MLLTTKKTKTRTMWTAVVHIGWCGVLLCLSELVVGADAASSYTCKPQFSGRNRMVLCNNASQVSSNGGGGGIGASREALDCGDPDQTTGFMLKRPVVLAPLSYYSNCRFHTEHLYDATCMANLTKQGEEYDRIIFDVLDKVSGQPQVPSPTLEQRFPMTVVKDGAEMGDVSNFVTFLRLCKPAYPKRDDVINLCSNHTKSGTFMYFTLRDMPEVPDVPSMCRCVLRPSTRLKLLALDVRLQNDGDHRCGKGGLKIETNDTKGKEVRCHKMSALYGNDELYSSDSPDEVTLTLTFISKEYRPKSAWISAQDKFNPKVKVMEVTCGGFIPLPPDQPDEGREAEGGGQEGGDGGEEATDKSGGGGGDSDGHQPAAQDAGGNFIIIVASVTGVIVFLIIVIVVAVIIVRRRRRSGNYSGLVPSCGCEPCCEDDDDNPFYKVVTQQEPIYSAPGRPRPSTTTPYVFPVDAKFPDSGGAVYAEPNPNGMLGLAMRDATPPPVPESPPPVSPPSASPPMFPPGTPPPKPARTLLRQHKESAKSGPSEEVEEDYDHIKAGERSPLKSPQGRDRQNNIIGDGEGVAEANVYDCLQSGENDYSQIGNGVEQQVKDNVYDTTM